MNERKRNVLLVAGCYVLWGVLPAFWTFLAALPAVFLLATRIVWAAVFCALALAVSGRLGELRTAFSDRKELRYLLFAAMAIAVNWGLFIYAVTNGRVLDSSLAYYMNPLFTIALSCLVYREKLRAAQWAALGIAFCGIVGVLIYYGAVPVIALLIAASFAAYGAIKKHVKTAGLASTAMESILLAPLALGYIIYAECTGQGAIGTLSGAQFLLLPLAGVVTAVPLMLFSRGIKGVPLSLSGMLMYVNPTLQLLLGVLVLRETLDAPRIVLFVCVWIAVILYVCSDARARRKARQTGGSALIQTRQMTPDKTDLEEIGGKDDAAM